MGKAEDYAELIEAGAEYVKEYGGRVLLLEVGDGDEFSIPADTISQLNDILGPRYRLIEVE